MKQAGQIYSLKVLRKTDIGYMLTDIENIDITNEYFLHKNQATKELVEGEIVLAFLYYDSQKRLTATMETPSVTLSQMGWSTVKTINHNIGIFVNININKDILISKDLLPQNKLLWPNEGDKLYIQLKSKSNQIVGKIVGKTLIHDHPFNLNVNDTVECYISRIMDEGLSCYTEDLNVIFIHKTQYRDNKYRLGQKLEVKIIKENMNREYSGSLILRKESQIDNDSLIILEYLKANNGKMRFGNDSLPEDIFKVFNMSKKAFKRALGHLYKERKINFIDNYTILVKE